MSRTTIVKAVVALAVVAFLAWLPYSWLPGLGILPDNTGAAGSLSLLSKVMVLAALAVSFDLLLGQTGLMSFGHVLYFGTGGYGFAMLLAHTDLGFWPAALLSLVITAGVSCVCNLVALRVGNIAYSMVTLAFAQVAAVMVSRNYFGTGGEAGLRLSSEKIPAQFVGLQNVANVYWVALGTVVFVAAVAGLVIRSRFGLALRGIRDNALRMQVLGHNVYLLRLAISVLASVLAGLCGVVYVLALGGADPSTVGLAFALSLIFMVVIGGSGTLAGALLGGVVYALLDLRLPAVGESLDGAPEWVSRVLGEPSFLLGVIFLAIVFLAPRGLLGVLGQLPRLWGGKAGEQERAH